MYYVVRVAVMLSFIYSYMSIMRDLCVLVVVSNSPWGSVWPRPGPPALPPRYWGESAAPLCSEPPHSFSPPEEKQKEIFSVVQINMPQCYFISYEKKRMDIKCSQNDPRTQEVWMPPSIGNWFTHKIPIYWRLVRVHFSVSGTELIWDGTWGPICGLTGLCSGL